MSSNCSVCNRFCILSGVGEDRGSLLSSTASEGVATATGWLPPSEQADSKGRDRSRKSLNQNFVTIPSPFQLFEAVANAPLSENIFGMGRVLFYFLS